MRQYEETVKENHQGSEHQKNLSSESKFQQFEMLPMGKKRLRKPNVNIGRGSAAGIIVVTPRVTQGEYLKVLERQVSTSREKNLRKSYKCLLVDWAGL